MAARKLLKSFCAERRLWPGLRVIMSIWSREAQFKDLLEKGVRKNSKSVIQQLVSIATEDEREVNQRKDQL